MAGRSLRTSVEDLRSDAARVALQLAFLANQAYEMLHAIAVTLVRLGDAHRRRLLEWETAAASAHRARRSHAAARTFVSEMIASPLMAVAAALVLVPADASRGAARGACRSWLLWAAAPLIALCAQPPGADAPRGARRRATASFFASVARKTWRYFETFVGAEDHALPPDNVQVVPDTDGSRTARRRPTSAWGCWRRLRRTTSGSSTPRADSSDRRDAHDRRGPRTVRRSSAELVRHAHAGPAAAGYVSTVDSGNLAGALMTLSVRALQRACAGLRLEAGRARRRASFDGMNFRFLYDPQRQLFTIGYRLADDEGPGRLDPVVLRPAGVRSAAGQLPRHRQGRRPGDRTGSISDELVTSVRGAPVLLSWSATMFEYLMPLLVMRSYPDTLLDESCRMVVRRQIEYAAARGVPWGISESAYNVVDRHDTYQYKAFGVPGLGLKRGLGDELVVAPYATALAAMIDPPRSAANLRRLTARGPRGRLRLLRRHRLHRTRDRRAIDAPADAADARRRRPHLPRAPRRA